MSGAAPAPRSQPESAWLQDLVPLRLQGPVELIDRASHIFRARVRDLVAVALAVNLPIWLVLAVVMREQWARGLSENPQWYLSSVLPEPFLLSTAGSGTYGSTVGFVLGRALPSLGLAVMGATAGTLVGSWAAGRPLDGIPALLSVLRRGHRLLALWAVIHAIELVTCVGLVIGPVLFGAAMPLWAIERTGVFTAVRRSFRLSTREAGRVLLTVLVATVLAIMVGIMLSAFPLLVIGAVTDGWIDLGGTGAVALASALPHLVIDPMLAVAMALMALDLKVRLDGADLTAELEELQHARGAAG